MVIERMEKVYSDHCPQLLNFGVSTQHRSLFRIYNVLAKHTQFKHIIRTNWGAARSQNLLQAICLKCQKIKGPLKQLNTQWFVNTSDSCYQA